MATLEQTGAKFTTTEWSLVEAACSRNGDQAAKRALAVLVERYWPAVYAALRRWGRGREDAAELTQGFFAEVVLQRQLFQRAEAEQGRLRTLILAALKRYVVDKHRRRQARGEAVTLSLEALQREEEILAGHGEPSPDAAFERRWALAGLQEALARGEAHFRAGGKAQHWELFERRVVSPIITGVEAPPLNEVYQDYGFTSAAAGAAAVQVVKKRVLALLREVVAETVRDESQADEEYALLLRRLGA